MFPCFLLALVCMTEGVSFTKKLAKHLQPPAQNFLILRLSHTGSSWFTSILGSQNSTYITREAIFPVDGPKRTDVRARVAAMSAAEISSYLERVLREPTGAIDDPDQVQLLDPEEFDQEAAPASLLALGSKLRGASGPETLECLKALGSKCRVQFLGATVDPTGTGLSNHLDEVLAELSAKHPSLPVIIFRRSNMVKRALAHGGMRTYRVESRKIRPRQLLRWVNRSLFKDDALFRAANHFNRKMVVTYEDLQAEPQRTMQMVFDFLGMPGHVTDEMLDNGHKHTPEDLRLVLDNFDEVAEAFDAVPCLKPQLLSTKVEVFQRCDPSLTQL